MDPSRRRFLSMAKNGVLVAMAGGLVGDVLAGEPNTWYKDKVLEEALRRAKFNRDATVTIMPNGYREALGEVSYDKGLCRDAEEHARYMVGNNIRGSTHSVQDVHFQDKKNRFYTKEGYRAGSNGVVSYPFGDPYFAIDAWEATLYHRSEALTPGKKDKDGDRKLKIGFGFKRYKHSRTAVAVLVADYDNKGNLGMVPYPGPGQKNVPLSFAEFGERPDPIGGRDPSETSFPITLEDYDRGKIRNVRWSLKDDSGKVYTEKDVLVSTPEKPALKYWPQPGLIGLMLKNKLPPGTRFFVGIKFDHYPTGKVPGKDKPRKRAVAWDFTTQGKRVEESSEHQRR